MPIKDMENKKKLVNNKLLLIIAIIFGLLVIAGSSIAITYAVGYERSQIVRDESDSELGIGTNGTRDDTAEVL